MVEQRVIKQLRPHSPRRKVNFDTNSTEANNCFQSRMFDAKLEKKCLEKKGRKEDGSLRSVLLTQFVIVSSLFTTFHY